MSKAPVLVRAAITPSEWRELRKRALDRGIPVSELVAILIRREISRSR